MNEVSTINTHQQWSGLPAGEQAMPFWKCSRSQDEAPPQAGDAGENVCAGHAVAPCDEHDTLSLSWLWILKYSGFRYQA